MTEFFQDFLSIGQDGLLIIATAILPVLFPFFVLTSLILNLTAVAHPWLVSLLAYCSGYPNGARLTKDLYQQQRINLSQARQLLITTSTPSPIFVIATVGVVFLRNIKLGCVIFICAVITAIINGWLWSPKHCKCYPAMINQTTSKSSNLFSLTFSNALTSATTAIVNVCGVILFFYIFSNMFYLPTFLAGLLEMTTGVAATANPYLIQFFVTFGGFSVAMQQQIFMQDFQIKFCHYLVFKFTHAILACGVLAFYLLFLD